MPNIRGKLVSGKNKFLSLSWKKKLLIIIGFIILGIIIFSALKPKPTGFTKTKAANADITETVSETGNVVSSGSVSVYSPTNGTIKDISISNGSVVQEGDVLFLVESSATELEQKEALTNYLAAKAAYDSANASLHTLQAAMFDAWDTHKNLAEGDAYENSDGSPKSDSRTLPEFHISEKEWLAAEAKYKNQQGVIAQAQAQMSSTWILYQATQNATVKAPASGTVSNLSVGIGGNVSINTPASPTRPVLLISSPSVTEVVISLSESDISKIKENQKAKIEISALDKTFDGIVKRVDEIGANDQGVIRYNTYIELPSSNPDIKAGMSADAIITTNTLKNVLSVPNSAVKPYQGGKAVRVESKKGEVTYIPVKIGVKGDSKTQIISGITEGQEVITSITNEKLKRSGGLFGG